jgi:energy-coupling factor transporter ATP-binding protein EcfA2
MSLWTIEAIEIGGGFLEGLSLRLPRGLTCIIGPRGSGKSTMAEAARYVLSGNSILPKARADLLQANLGGGVVALRTSPDARGEAWIIRRQYKQPASLSSSTGRVVTSVDLDRGTFLPLDAYASAEIEAIADEALGDRRRALLDELIVDDLRPLQALVSEHRRALEANAEQQKTAQREIQGLTEKIEELRDPRARLALLPPAPLDSTSSDLLTASRQQQMNIREVTNLTNSRAALSALSTELSQVLSVRLGTFSTSVVVEGSANAGLIAKADVELRGLVDRTVAALTAIQKDTAERDRVLAEITSNLQIQQGTQASLFNDLHQRNSAMSEAARVRAAIEQEMAQVTEYERQRNETHIRLRELTDARKRLKVKYLGERAKISEMRRDIANHLQRDLGNKVRMLVIANADLQAYQQILVKGLYGARVRNHEDILDALLRIAPDQLGQIIRDNDVDEFERLCSFGAERAAKILGAFRENVDAYELELVAIEDQIRIELNVSPGDVEHFKDASELSRGQKCTALLPLLLARRNSPLIIDQPEDNLDNHFIYETVVEAIRRQKQYRQMIFITHNANIPVLGEAELVVVMDSDGRRGAVVKAGTVDQCRSEIIDLLEGGEEAFELRRQRYAKR